MPIGIIECLRTSANGARSPPHCWMRLHYGSTRKRWSWRTCKPSMLLHVLPLTSSSENCAIEPGNIRPRVENGAPIASLDTASEAPADTSSDAHSLPTDAEDPGVLLSKMLDVVVAIMPTRAETQVFSHRLTGYRQHERSLNQTKSFISQLLIFLDIELKRTHQLMDPTVQLAVWQQAGLLKRQFFGWDTTFPMPGITIDGHIWRSYLSFGVHGRLVSLFLFDLQFMHRTRADLCITRSCSGRWIWDPLRILHTSGNSSTLCTC